MAVMIPDNIQNFCTKGERHFYVFLKANAKPDSKKLVWYLPDINLAHLLTITGNE